MSPDLNPGWELHDGQPLYCGPPWLGNPALEPKRLPFQPSSALTHWQTMMNRLHGADVDDTQVATNYELMSRGLTPPPQTRPWWMKLQRKQPQEHMNHSGTTNGLWAGAGGWHPYENCLRVSTCMCNVNNLELE